jgi:hypothetical protein
MWWSQWHALSYGFVFDHQEPFGLSLSKPGAALRQAPPERIEIDILERETVSDDRMFEQFLAQLPLQNFSGLVLWHRIHHE